MYRKEWANGNMKKDAHFVDISFVKSTEETVKIICIAMCEKMRFFPQFHRL